MTKRLRSLILRFFLVSFIFIGIGISASFSEAFLSKIEKKYGDYAKRRVIAWHKLSTEHKKDDERTKLEEVNRFFNLLEFKTDQEIWGKSDYWTTPLEFIVMGAGDCEDFTVAKYFTLLDLNVPDEKLLITYVKAVNLNQAHMVLAYYATPDAVPLILDNLNKEILPADERKDLIPVYSFNGKGLWKAKQGGLGARVGKSSDLEKWVDLEERMKLEKIEASKEDKD